MGVKKIVKSITFLLIAALILLNSGIKSPEKSLSNNVGYETNQTYIDPDPYKGT